jgi:hypothetical protein
MTATTAARRTGTICESSRLEANATKAPRATADHAGEVRPPKLAVASICDLDATTMLDLERHELHLLVSSGC